MHSQKGYTTGKRIRLLPQRFCLPSSGESHCSGINYRILGKKCLDVLCESVSGINGIKPVGDITQMWIKFVTTNLFDGNPQIWQMFWKVGLDYDIDIPKSSVMSTYITDNCNATQPVTHVFKLRNHEATTDSLLCCTIIHIGIKFGKRTKRGDLQCLPKIGRAHV